MQERRRSYFFEGVIQCSLHTILGPIPSAVHPTGFIGDEEAKRLTEEAMLLLVVDERQTSHTIMSFPEISKLGVVGIYPNPSGNTLAIIVIFNEKARGMLWRAYPLIRNLILNEAVNAKDKASDVTASLFGEIQELCDYLSEEIDVEEVKDLLERNINASLSIESPIDSDLSRTHESISAGLRASLSNLVTVLRNTKLARIESL